MRKATSVSNKFLSVQLHQAAFYSRHENPCREGKRGLSFFSEGKQNPSVEEKKSPFCEGEINLPKPTRHSSCVLQSVIVASLFYCCLQLCCQYNKTESNASVLPALNGSNGSHCMHCTMYINIYMINFMGPENPMYNVYQHING